MSEPCHRPSAQDRHRPSLSATALALTIFLGACGDGTPQGGTDTLPSIGTAEAEPSTSAESPAGERTNALRETSAAAEGREDDAATPEPEIGTATPELEPALRPANPLEIVAEPTSATRSEPAPVSGRTSALEPASSPSAAPAPGRAPDTDSRPADEAEKEPPRRFVSDETEGFVGEVLENGTVRVSWPERSGARGYNVHRMKRFAGSVASAAYVDDDTFDGDYYYEVDAYDSDGNITTIATGLWVKVRGVGADPSAPPPNRIELEGYDLVFADEFDTGALDATKWSTRFIWGPDVVINNERQYYVDIQREPDFGFDPFTFENGALTINAVPTPNGLRSKANGQPYLSGLITSYDSFQFTYGYAEARARVPYGRGYWPAFWLLNGRYGGREPEIDIMEFLGHDEDTVYHTYHYFDYPAGVKTLHSTESQPTLGADYTADFHTYAVDWRPGRIIYFVDGVEVHRISDPMVSNQDMYLIANLALGGWWAGEPDGSTPFPGRYELDYIRVYRQRAPYELPPSSDEPSSIAPASKVPKASPGHHPPFELWPRRVPGRG